MHHPGLDAFRPVDVSVGDYQLNGLAEHKFGSGFDKDTAATYILNDAFVFLIRIIEKYWFLKRFARISPGVLSVFNAAGVHFLLRKIRLNIFFCDRFHRLNLLIRPPSHPLDRSFARISLQASC